ncbi:MAG: hypothetical protein UV54_C0006G0008 [Candidatus Beckwithbacteria bacterium GW2011_GWA2_43_10]|uniref:DUF3048 domain-containing protein n=1 Tax=Candidatus Beckwithbacteria bacterium GW2011_GWA2_43_10 TaxID=1618369 RepID=A0A0G1F0T7_9BACT|nr:MAG: hypothetical protein UV54_C0006G0008 [Candidatus Beckwithbacteria bacterium GW2011_GWA2_43_10]
MKIANPKLLLILSSLGIYLLSAGIAYAVFIAANSGTIFTSPLTDTTNNPIEDNNNRKALIEVSGSKSETCPLNGAKFTRAEKNIWESRRPLAVMIENHLEARPQSGLSDADIIYEAVAEGGITRFMALFYCQAAAYETTLGPIRSARTYFVDWASEYNLPLYVHVGGANTPGPANALGQLDSYGWAGANDLNQFSIGYPTFWRDYERLGRTVATEHTMYSTTEKLWAVGAKRGFTNLDPEQNNWLDDFTPWKFAKEEIQPANRGAVQKISYPFWEYTDYDVSWQYDKDQNLYQRSNAGQLHQDLNTNQPLTAKNLIVQLVSERKANDGYPDNVHLLYGTTGKGKAYIFKDGQAIEGSWVKTKRLSRTIFSDDQGKEIIFNPGKIWISVLPVGTKVAY